MSSAKGPVVRLINITCAVGVEKAVLHDVIVRDFHDV
jgi:hypothetical protein